jgi:gluconolactonase
LALVFVTAIYAQNVTYGIADATAFNAIFDTTATTATAINGQAQPLVFLEGPLWNPNTSTLYVGDAVPNGAAGNLLYVVNPATPSWTGETNTPAATRPLGNAWDKQGRLLTVGLQGLTRSEGGVRTVLASMYNGSTFNLPNDLCVKNDGSIYFSDPDYNFLRGTPSPQPSENIYRYDPTTMNVTAVWPATPSQMKPNGVAFSPSENYFYFGTGTGEIWRCVATAASPYISGCATFIPGCGADGLKVDAAGNIWAACGSTVTVFTSAGVQIGNFSISGAVYHSNFAWGGANGKTLFITTQTSLDFVTFNTSLFRGELYSLRLNQASSAAPSASTSTTPSPGGNQGSATALVISFGVVLQLAVAALLAM